MIVDIAVQKHVELVIRPGMSIFNLSCCVQNTRHTFLAVKLDISIFDDRAISSSILDSTVLEKLNVLHHVNACFEGIFYSVNYGHDKRG
jgi:hypothetical protein